MLAESTCHPSWLSQCCANMKNFLLLIMFLVYMLMLACADYFQRDLQKYIKNVEI